MTHPHFPPRSFRARAHLILLLSDDWMPATWNRVFSKFDPSPLGCSWFSVFFPPRFDSSFFDSCADEIVKALSDSPCRTFFYQSRILVSKKTPLLRLEIDFEPSPDDPGCIDLLGCSFAPFLVSSPHTKLFRIVP